MAALMKKRVLAEFTQSQTITVAATAEQQQQPPAKRLKTLRLLSSSGGGLSAGKNGSTNNKGGSALAYVECLEKCKGGNDALQLLVRISDTIGQMALEDIPTVVKKLAERFAIEQEAAVRAKILWIFAELGEIAPDSMEKTKIVNETANLLKNEESHRVKSQGLASLLKLGDYNRSLVLKIARDHLSDTWHGVQTRCLSIIGRYLSAVNAAADDTLALVNNYSKSQDPRVRAQAFETMAELHAHRGCRLPASFFQEACQCLRDDYEIVRRAVLKLIWLLGNEYPENIISGGREFGEDMRMVDSAFCKLCSLMGDLSPRVRASAMSLLGSLKNVSRRHIEQALDKKQIRVEDEGSGGGAVEERPGLNTCGAFIHGLEDEFLEIRTAAVESLCALSLERPSIAHISLEFMVDMFNDEIQDVRLRAIESLRKMSAHVTLSEDQLETILGALEDFSGEVREGLHATLGASRLATKICLNMCVSRLVDNLNRYPQDLDSIFKCLASMGASHPYLTLPLVPQLLTLHPFYDTPEPNVTSPSLTTAKDACLLVLIFNAAAHCPSMHALFANHTVKHYHYLRDTMPHLVPRLKPVIVIGSSSSSSTATKKSDDKSFVKDEQVGGGNEQQQQQEGDDDENARKFLEKIVESVERHMLLLQQQQQVSSRPGGRVYTQLLEAAAVDLDRLAEMDLRVEGVARFSALYIRCILLLKSITRTLTLDPNAKNLKNLGSSTAAAAATAAITTQINLLHRNAQKLLRLFIGLGEYDTALATDVWLKALALDLVRAANNESSNALTLARNFLNETDSLLPAAEDALKLPPFSKALVLQLPALVASGGGGSNEAKPVTLVKLLLPLLMNNPPPPSSLLLKGGGGGEEEEKLPRPPQSTKFCQAIIEDPVSESDNVYKFTGGLILGVPLTAKILNLRDPGAVRIKLRHPDQKVQLLLPRKSDLKKLASTTNDNGSNSSISSSTNNDYRLRTRVLLSHQVWMEACSVDVSIALLVPSSIPSSCCTHSPLDDPCVIDLCKPTKISIMPKPVKRGI